MIAENQACLSSSIGSSQPPAELPRPTRRPGDFAFLSSLTRKSKLGHDTLTRYARVRTLDVRRSRRPLGEGRDCFRREAIYLGSTPLDVRWIHVVILGENEPLSDAIWQAPPTGSGSLQRRVRATTPHAGLPAETKYSTDHSSPQGHSGQSFRTFACHTR
jgi:hypothetical protein